jgi:hypothetical protein
MMMRGAVRLLPWFCSLLALAACGGDHAPGAAAGMSSAAAGAGQGEGGGGAGGAGAGGAGGIGCLEDEDGSPGEGGAPACAGPGARFVTTVLSACFGAGQSVGQDMLPGAIAGPPKGGGCCGGSFDVVSLGNGGSIIVAFEGNAIVDGPGPDFIVFENAFNLGNDPLKPFAELATVEVSEDGVHWSAFPCTATAYPYGSCAGWHPVFANAEENTIDPLDPSAAGGDPFDLADVGLEMARFVRITDRPDTPTVFDLDTVGIVHARCP